MTYSERLQQAIDKAGETHSSLARKLACSRQTIFLAATWTGEKERTLGATLHALAAKALNVDPDWLLTGAEPKTDQKTKEVSKEAESLDLVLKSIHQDYQMMAYQEALQGLIAYLAKPASSAPTPNPQEAKQSEAPQQRPLIGSSQRR